MKDEMSESSGPSSAKVDIAQLLGGNDLGPT